MFPPAMVSRAKKTRKAIDMMGSVTVDALKLAVPLAKAIPLLGPTIEGSLEAVLYILEVKDDVKMKKEKCRLLADRVVAIMAAITTEVMKADPATLARRESSVAALRGTLRGIQTLLEDLSSATLVRRVFKRGDIDDKLTQFNQQLDTAIDSFHITETMRTEDALAQLSAAIREEQDKHDILFLKTLLRPVTTASYLARAPDTGCFAGTRRVLLDQISTWLNVDSPRVPRVFWLSGLGGTGKTAISHTVCEKMHTSSRLGQGGSNLGASIFFSRDEADRRRVPFIIPTLAYQLASVNPAYRRKLCEVLKVHPDAPSRAQQYQLKELLVDPLKEVPSLPPYVIVLDALDECDKERDREGGDLIPLFLRELLHSGLNIKVFITSRPERSIEGMFRAAGHGTKIYDSTILHDIDQSTVKEDIELYLRHHFECIQANRNITPPWPGGTVLNDLVSRAGLFFIFATTIVQFVADAYYSPQTQLQKLFNSGNTQSHTMYVQVDLLYLQILRSSLEGRADALELSARFRKIVGAIILLQDPLSISTLAHLVGHDQADLEAALTPLHSLLDIPANTIDPIRIFHPSFCDFLLTEERCRDSRFAIPEGQTHARLALCCLQVMLRHLKRNICDIGPDAVLNSEIPDLKKKLGECVPPALSYACQHWGVHLSHSMNDAALGELLERLLEFASMKLLNWIELLSLEGRFSLCVDNLVAVTGWCKANSAGPKVSRLIYDASRLVLDFHQAIQVSAVQVYHSALVFIPNCSLLHAYKHELPAVHMTTPRTDNWDVSVLVFEGHRNIVNMVSISREESRAASVSDDGHVRLWDTLNGGQVSCFEGHDGPVKSVEFSPDSSYIVSGGSDARIRVWDATTGFNIYTLTGHQGGVNSVIFTSDGRNIVSGSDDTSVRMWDVLGNQHHVLNGHLGAVTCLAFLADDSRVLSGGMDSTIHLWDMQTATAVKILQCADAILSLAVSPSREKPIFLSGSQDGVITIWDADTLEEAGRLVGHTGEVKSVAFGVHGKKVVSGSADGTIRIWNTTDKFCVAEYRGHSGPVECTRFTVDGAGILSGSADRTLRMWDAKVEGVHGSKDYIMAVEIPDDVEHIISGSTNGKVALWKTSDSSLVYEVDVHRGAIYCLALPDDDKQVASASADHTICILDMRHGTNFATFQGHTAEVYTVEFSSDASLLVSSSKDGHVKIWDIHAKKLKRSLIHNDGVGVASFSPDDKYICSGAFDKAIHIWDAETGDQVTVLKEYPSPCLWVLFSPSGKWLASWFEDEAVKVWRVQGTEFQPWPHKEWRLDRQANTINSGAGIEPVGFDDLLPSHEYHYLQEDGWIIFPRTGKRVCWVPPSRRQPWLRTLWVTRKGMFVTGSQAGNLTIVDLRSTVRVN